MSEALSGLIGTLVGACIAAFAAMYIPFLQRRWAEKDRDGVEWQAKLARVQVAMLELVAAREARADLLDTALPADLRAADRRVAAAERGLRASAVWILNTKCHLWEKAEALASTPVGPGDARWDEFNGVIRALATGLECPNLR